MAASSAERGYSAFISLGCGSSLTIFIDMVHSPLKSLFSQSVPKRSASWSARINAVILSTTTRALCIIAGS